MTLLKNKWFWIVVISFIMVLVIYSIGKSAGRKKSISLPHGGKDIPDGWDPAPAAAALYGAFNYFSIWNGTTDEETILATLSQLSTDQVAAVYNFYNAKYHADDDETLLDDLESELSGSDLTSALSYFNGIDFTR